MPDEAPDAPVADPPDAAPPDTAPAEGGAADIDLSTLPRQAQNYIHELREEAKARRLEHEPYKNAFSHFNEAEQTYLINMVDHLGVDDQAGATAMLELSQRVLGIEAEAAEITADPEVQTEAAAAGISIEEVKQIVKQEQEQAVAIAGVEAETRALGFEPGTPEAAKLWDMAMALQEGDLSKVAPLVRQHLGIAEPAAEEESEVPSDAEFPVTGTPAASGADTNHDEAAAVPGIKSQEMRDRVARRLAAAAGE